MSANVQNGPRKDAARFKKAVIVATILHVAVVAGMNLDLHRIVARRSFAPIQMIDLGGMKGGRRASGGGQKPAPAVAKPTPPPPPAMPKPAPAPPVAKAPPIAKAPPKPPPSPLKPTALVQTSPNAVAVPVAKPQPKKPEPQYTESDYAQKLAKMREKYSAAEPPQAETSKRPANVSSAIENIRKRVGETAPAQRAAPDAKAVSAAGAGPAGVVVGSSGTGALQAMRSIAYWNQLWAHVKKNWVIPPSLQGKELQVGVGVTIGRSGEVMKSWIENSSGNDSYDQAALRAIMRSSPLPPIPPGMSDEEFKDGIVFRFRE